MTRDQLIMLFHDGELAELEAAEARELLSRDPAARALLANLQLVSVLIAERPLAQPSADITSQVMAQVLKEAGPSQGSSPPAIGLLARRTRVKRAVTAVSVALSLAAGVALLSARRPAGSSARADVEVAAPVGAFSAPELDPPEESVAIERIDFGEDPGAIFLVPGLKERTLVVWTIDDTADKGPEVEL